MSDMMVLPPTIHTLNFAPIETGRNVPAKNSGQTDSKFRDVLADAAAIAVPANGAGIILRPPETVNAVAPGAIKAALGNIDRQTAQAAQQKLAQFETSGFDISTIGSDRKSELLINILNVLQMNKTAERTAQAKMSVLNGQATDMAAAATKNAGAAAFSGSIAQGAASVGLTGASTYMNQKAIGTDRITNKTVDRQIIASKDTLNLKQLNLAKSNDTALGASQRSGKDTIDVNGNRTLQIADHSPQVTPRQQAILKDAATHDHKNALALKQNHSKDEYLKTEQTRGQASFVGQAAFPVGNIVNGATQMAQAGHNADQQISQQVGQAAKSMEDSNNTSARDYETAIQNVLQTLEKIQKDHIDTAGMIASKSI